MKFDINEAREIIEAAKKRGAIREAGSTQAAASSKEESPAKDVVLPEWLRGGFDAPSARDKPSSPEWR